MARSRRLHFIELVFREPKYLCRILAYVPPMKRQRPGAIPGHLMMASTFIKKYTLANSTGHSAGEFWALANVPSTH
jgi:hypothetical protein